MQILHSALSAKLFRLISKPSLPHLPILNQVHLRIKCGGTGFPSQTAFAPPHMRFLIRTLATEYFNSREISLHPWQHRVTFADVPFPDWFFYEAFVVASSVELSVSDDRQTVAREDET